MSPSTTASTPSPTAAAEHATPSMRSCTTAPGGSAPPRHARTRVPPPPRSGLRSQRPERSSGAAAKVRGYMRPASRSAAAKPLRVAHRAQRLRRVAEQRVALRQPRDERRVVLEARPVDDAARRHLHRGVDQRGQAPARQRHDARTAAAQVEVAEQIERGHRLTVAHRQIGEHARAQSNQEKWLARCDGVRGYLRAARRTGSLSPHRRWSPGSARCRARAAMRRSCAAPAARPRCARRRRASTSRAPADTRAAASAPRLRAISVSGAASSSRRCSSTIASRSAEPIAQRGDERRDPGLEGQGEVADVLRGDRVARGGARHGLAQADRRLGAHVVLDALVAGRRRRRGGSPRTRRARRPRRARAASPRAARAAARRRAPPSPAERAAARSRGSCSPAPRGATPARPPGPCRPRRARPRAPARGRPRSRCAPCPRRWCRGSRGWA